MHLVAMLLAEIISLLPINYDYFCGELTYGI